MNCVNLEHPGPSRYPALPAVEQPKIRPYVPCCTMEEIIPGLFLGPFASAAQNSLAAMKNAGLTHVVCVRAAKEADIIKPCHPTHFQYLVIEMESSDQELVIPKVKTVKQFIDTCLDGKGKVLVHDIAGVSKSAALVVGYIMSRYGVTFQKARNYVASKMGAINIDEGFAFQLKQYEMIYKAMHSIPEMLPFEPEVSEPGGQSEVQKRSIDEVEEEEENSQAGNPRRLRIEEDSNVMDVD